MRLAASFFFLTEDENLKMNIHVVTVQIYIFIYIYLYKCIYTYLLDSGGSWFDATNQMGSEAQVDLVKKGYAIFKLNCKNKLFNQ